MPLIQESLRMTILAAGGHTWMVACGLLRPFLIWARCLHLIFLGPKSLGVKGDEIKFTFVLFPIFEWEVYIRIKISFLK